MRSHFEKYAFLHHIFVFIPNYIVTVCNNLLLLLVRNCCDIKRDVEYRALVLFMNGVISSQEYITSLHYKITFPVQTYTIFRNDNKHLSKREKSFFTKNVTKN